MKARYVLRENPGSDAGDDDKSPNYHPRLVSSGTINKEKLFSEVAEYTTFSAAELEGAMNLLLERAARYISQGYMVELGKLGFLSGALKNTRPIIEPKNIRSETIVMHNVNLRASQWFRSHACGLVERANRGFGKSADIGFEEKVKRLYKHLDDFHFITRKEYGVLTGLLKNKALEELRQLVKEGELTERGHGSHIVFIRRKDGKKQI